MVEFSVTSNETITVSPEYVGSRLLLKLKEMAPLKTCSLLSGPQVWGAWDELVQGAWQRSSS